MSLLRWIIILCWVLVLNNISFGSYEEVGRTAATFLKIGIDGRACALGEAYVGLAEGVGSIYWNPAGLAQNSKREATFMHNAYIEEINHEFIGYIHPVKENERGIGIGIIGLFIDDIVKKTKATFDDEGSFGNNDYCVIFSIGQKIKEHISGGLSLKIIYQELDSEEGMGLGVDTGILCKDFIGEGFDLGVVLQNIGPKMKIYEEEFNLPGILRVGIAKHLWDERAVLVTDIVKPFDNNVSIHIGLEYRVLNSIFLRGGYQYRIEDLEDDLITGFNCGLGLGIKDFGIDYAFTPYDKLEESHRISIRKGF